jgi:ABC-type Na+ efflux pump permease subunit
MWNFLLALFAGNAVGSTRTAQRSVKPIAVLFLVGVLIAGVIYVCVVFKAVSERNSAPHVNPHRSH